VIADTYLSVSTPAQVALPKLLARRDELQAPIRERVRGNLEALCARLGGSSATLLAPEGGWYAVLRVPATLGEEERVVRLLAERDVLVHPGYFFDFPNDAHLVLSLLTPADDFAEGVDRLLADVESG
jgi:aspartate/methionine/tyrosine aminotransferase